MLLKPPSKKQIYRRGKYIAWWTTSADGHWQWRIVRNETPNTKSLEISLGRLFVSIVRAKDTPQPAAEFYHETKFVDPFDKYKDKNGELKVGPPRPKYSAKDFLDPEDKPNDDL